MKRGAGICGIGVDAYYPVLKLQTSQRLKPIYAPTDCMLKRDAYSSNGAYIKSFCIETYSRGYENSRVNCLRKGMQLFQLESEEANSALFNASFEFWSKRFFFNEMHISKNSENEFLIISNKEPFGPVRMTQY